MVIWTAVFGMGGDKEWRNRTNLDLLTDQLQKNPKNKKTNPNQNKTTTNTNKKTPTSSISEMSAMKRRRKPVLKQRAHFPFTLGTTACHFASFRKGVAVLWRLHTQTVEKMNKPFPRASQSL